MRENYHCLALSGIQILSILWKSKVPSIIVYNFDTDRRTKTKRKDKSNRQLNKLFWVINVNFGPK